MMKTGYTMQRPLGSIAIQADALSSLVVAAAERVDGARVRRPRRGLEVSVAGGRAKVALELTARYGIVLPELAQAVQASVTEALRESTGLTVDAVDVSIEELAQ